MANRYFRSLMKILHPTFLALLLTGKFREGSSQKNIPKELIVYCYFMPVCSIVKIITLRCRRRPDALLYKAKCLVQ